MKTDSSRIAQGFDRLAPWYDRLVQLVFGKAVKNIQIDLLAHLKPDSRILILGGGTGWILEEIFRHTKPSQVVYVELSSAMIGLAQQKAKTSGLPSKHIDFLQGTQEDLAPVEKFDAILTFFYLDLFTLEEVLPVMTQLDRRLLPGGRWLFADFIPQNPWQQALLWVMYRFFQLTCRISGHRLLPYDDLFERLGYHPEMKSSRWLDMVQGRVWRK